MLLANEFNWVRADSLQPLSIEMVALLGGLVLAWRYRSNGLIAMFAISLPFNDVVYRLGPVTVSDILAIAIIITRPPRTRPWLVTPLLLWTCWALANTLLYSQSLYSFAYGFRFALVLLVMGTVDLSRPEAIQIVRVLRSVTILAAGVSLTQVVLWRIGLPINGVFAASGFIRPKGLSHEPSTSAAWFAMAIPLLSVSRSRRGRFDGWLAAAISIGLLLTASLSGFIIVAVQAIFFVIRAVKVPAYRRRLAVATCVAIPLLLLAVAMVGSQATLLVDKTEQLVDEYASGVRPTSLTDSSGREGDLLLLNAAPPSMLHGQGAFVAQESAAAIQEASGAYAPTANILITAAIDTGIIGLALLVLALAAAYVGARRELYRRFPAFVDGFAGFLAATLGQRLLAFPQPWFMLAVARGLNHPDENPADSAELDLARTESPDNRAGDVNVNTDVGNKVTPVSAVRRYPYSSALIVVLGIVLLTLGVGGRLQGQSVTIDLGRTGLNELAAGLDLPVVDAETYSAQDEAFYINHAYGSVSATVAGEVVVVAASADEPSAAQAVLESFADDYLAYRNADWISTFESARERSEALASRARGQIEVIDGQLAANSVDEATASQLVLARSELVSDLASAETDAQSYSVMLEDGGPMAVVGGPRTVSSSSFLLVVAAAAGVLVIVMVAVGQAMWRSLRAPEPPSGT